MDNPTITLIRGGGATTRPVERSEDVVLALLVREAELEAQGYRAKRVTHSADKSREMMTVHLETSDGKRATLTLTEYKETV